MNAKRLTAFFSAALLGAALADPETKPLTEAEKAKSIAEHQAGAEKVSIDQDKQTANTQELILEQTDQKVIALLEEVETLMAKTTDRLEDADTGGDTIAFQTEIIEKIYEAAKQKSQSPSSGQGKGMSNMLEMMGQMMGKEPGKKEGEGSQSGEGATGDSDTANTDTSGPSKGKKDQDRRVPRAAGKTGTGLPAEFRKALDGYNKLITPKK